MRRAEKAGHQNDPFLPLGRSHLAENCHFGASGKKFDGGTRRGPRELAAKTVELAIATVATIALFPLLAMLVVRGFCRARGSATARLKACRYLDRVVGVQPPLGSVREAERK